jgi:peptide/nickel transport system ATP-binding protein
MDNILTIQDLRVDLLSTKGIVHAVRGINLELKKGEIHGFVGESGCGKTMTVKSILRLHDGDRTEYSGSINYVDRDILKMNQKQLQQMRGKEISMIFQDPMVSLNPLLTVGEQIGEMLRIHLGLDKKQARERTILLLEKVGIYPAEKRCDQYPFEFSGGMLQRIMIAIAISCNPKILIADEPTTALDVTIQAQILELLKDLQKKTGMTILFITHNFGVVAEICDRVSVMYAGRIVETGDVGNIFNHPAHPYSSALIDSIPKSGRHEKRLITIQGSPPQLWGKIKGCSFAPRCAYADEKCRTAAPGCARVNDGHIAECYHPL